ncbi:hypothetical protein [Halobaculum rubrum]|uniref:hypothetical protein n=1 Tax=Halobaculum rubrum TaxID=2872158 RepID=UPI001CA3C16C|nr:hypothetical protein [Halobaculum rubrum]QZY00484.1 hypothetical protein K6T25_05185 [Halobaculum rubrum]
MTEILVDATTLIALGNVDALSLLSTFDGPILVPRPVAAEVTIEPASTALERAVDSDVIEISTARTRDESDAGFSDARHLLGDDETNGDVALIADILRRGSEPDVAVVSDDRRVRRVAEGLGAAVTGTIGVVIRGVADECLDEEAALSLLDRLEERGLHTTTSLRTRAERLIRDAAGDRE